MSTSHPDSPRQGRPWLWATAIPVILAAALVVRFAGLGEPSLWLDEILHLEIALGAREAPWHAWLTGVAADRENGPLFYAGQLLALGFFDHELAVRLLPALAGFASVGALALAAFSATGSRRVAAAAATLLAVSPLNVYFSREGRPYAAVMLAAALFLLLALESRRRGSRRRRVRRQGTNVAVYVLALASAWLGALSGPVLLSAAVLAAGEWFRHRRGGHCLLAAVTGLLASLLLFPTAEHVGAALGGGRDTAVLEITRPLSLTAFDRLLASLTVSGLDRGSADALSFLLLALAVWGAVRLLRGDSSRGTWVVGMFLLPVGGWLAVLVLLRHWYNVRYTSAGLPAFLLLVAVGLVDVVERLGRWLRRRAGERLAWTTDTSLVAILLLLAVPAWRTARAEPLEKPDWRGVARLIADLAADDEPVIARGRWAETCVRYYLRRAGSAALVLSADHDLEEARRLTRRQPRAWVLAAGYWQTAELQAWMRTLDPVFKSRQGQIELFFFPDFPSFLSLPERFRSLASAAAASGSGSRQELTDSELMLGRGWFFPEHSPDGTSFRWAGGDGAEMALLAPPGEGPRSLRLRLLPFPSPNRPPQSAAVAVNARPLTTITLEPGWNEVSLPPYDGHPVADLVTFEFAWSQSPRELDHDSPDGRRLAAAFDFVEVVAAP